MSKVIHRKNLPARLPIFPTIIGAMAIEVWNLPEWSIGALCVFGLLIWIAAIWALYKNEFIDIFKQESKDKKSKFQERLEAAMEKEKSNQ